MEAGKVSPYKFNDNKRVDPFSFVWSNSILYNVIRFSENTMKSSKRKSYVGNFFKLENSTLIEKDCAFCSHVTWSDVSTVRQNSSPKKIYREMWSSLHLTSFPRNIVRTMWCYGASWPLFLGMTYLVLISYYIISWWYYDSAACDWHVNSSAIDGSCLYFPFTFVYDFSSFYESRSEIWERTYARMHSYFTAYLCIWRNDCTMYIHLLPMSTPCRRTYSVRSKCRVLAHL